MSEKPLARKQLEPLRSKGLFLVVETLGKRLRELVQLNLLLLGSCLFIITIPAALTAGSRIIVLMIQGAVFDLPQEYFRCLKREFVGSTIGGFILLFLIVLCFFTETLYLFYFGTGYLAWALLSLGFILLVLLIVTFYHFLVLVAIADLSFWQALKNAWLLAIVRLATNFLYLLVLIMVVSAHFSLWPYSSILVLVVSLSLGLLLTSVNAYENISAFVFVGAESENEEERKNQEEI